MYQGGDTLSAPILSCSIGRLLHEHEVQIDIWSRLLRQAIAFKHAEENTSASPDGKTTAFPPLTDRGCKYSAYG